MKKENVCLVLTATIEVKNVVFTERNSTLVRLNDYLKSFNFWLQHKDVENIIFIENSGYDLSIFKTVASNSNKNIEFLSYVEEPFDPEFGKGYGEKLIFIHLVEYSVLLYKCEKFIKISGRYLVTNYKKILQKFKLNTDIYCDLTKNLSYSESVFFGGSINFLINYIYKNNFSINDSKGIYFEHFLAQCYLNGIKDNLNFQFFIIKPSIIGFSGTTNFIIKPNVLKNKILSIVTFLKSKLLKF